METDGQCINERPECVLIFYIASVCYGCTYYKVFLPGITVNNCCIRHTHKLKRCYFHFAAKSMYLCFFFFMQNGRYFCSRKSFSDLLRVGEVHAGRWDIFKLLLPEL